MYDTFGDKRALFLRHSTSNVTEKVRSINVGVPDPRVTPCWQSGGHLSTLQNAEIFPVQMVMGINAICEFRDAR